MARTLSANETTSNTTALYNSGANTAGVYLAAPNTRMILDVNAMNQPQPQIVDLAGFTMTIEGQTAYSCKSIISANNDSTVTITDSIVYISGNRNAGNSASNAGAIDADGEVLIRNTGGGSREQFNSGTMNFIRCQVYFQNEGITIWPANTNNGLLGYVLNATDTDFYANEGPVTFHGRGARGSLGAAAIVLTRCRFFGNFTFNQPLAADYYGTLIPVSANAFDGRAVSFQVLTDPSRWIVFGDAQIQWARTGGILAYDINGNHYAQSAPRAALFIGESTIFTARLNDMGMVTGMADRVAITNYVNGNENNASYASRMFGWNPRFQSGDTTTEIADIKLRFPLVDVDPNPVVADRDASWDDQVFRPWPDKSMIPTAIAVAPDSTDPAIPDANVVTHTNEAAGGYWWQVYQANGLGTRGAAPTVASSVPTAIDTVRSVQAYSFTHNAIPVNSRHNSLDATGFTTTDNHSFAEDLELPLVTGSGSSLVIDEINGTRITRALANTLTAVNREDLVRPALKANNYDNNKLHQQTTNGTSQVYDSNITEITYAASFGLAGEAATESSNTIEIHTGTSDLTFDFDQKVIRGDGLATVNLAQNVTYSNGGIDTTDEGTVNFNSGTVTGLTVSANTIENVRASSFNNSTVTFTGTIGTTAEPNIALPAGSYSNLILGGTTGRVQFTGGGTYTFAGTTSFGRDLTLERSGSGTVTVALTAPATEGEVFPSGTPSFVVIAAEPVTNIISIPRIENGYYRIDATRSGTTTQLVGTTRFTQNSDPDTSNSISDTGIGSFAAGDSITIYLKYDSFVSSTADNRIYQEFRQTIPFNTTGGTLSPSSTGSVANALVGNAIPAPTGVVAIPTLEASVDIAGVTYTNQFLVTINNNNTSSALRLSVAEGQGLAAIIANDEDYFNDWYATRVGVSTAELPPKIIYDQGSLTTWNNTTAFRSANTITTSEGTFRIQHTAENWGGLTRVDARTGAAELVGVVADLALIDPNQVAQSINASSLVQSINTNADYVADWAEWASTSAGGPENGRRFGIQPRTADAPSRPSNS